MTPVEPRKNLQCAAFNASTRLAQLLACGVKLSASRKRYTSQSWKQCSSITTAMAGSRHASSWLRTAMKSFSKSSVANHTSRYESCGRVWESGGDTLTHQETPKARPPYSQRHA